MEKGLRYKSDPRTTVAPATNGMKTSRTRISADAEGPESFDPGDRSSMHCRNAWKLGGSYVILNSQNESAHGPNKN